MNLCDAIKKAIDTFGKDILLDGKRLFNILNDFQAFENKAQRRVSGTILEMGYGRHLHALYGMNESERQIKFKSYISIMENEGLQREIVCEVFENFSIAFDWGPLNSPSEQNNVQPQRKKKAKTEDEKRTSLALCNELLEKSRTPKSRTQSSHSSVSSVSKVKTTGGTVIPSSSSKSKKTQLNDSLKETLRLAQAGKSLNEIARIRRLKVGTIELHFVELIEKGQLKGSDYVDLRTYLEVSNAYTKMGNPSPWELYIYFDQAYDFQKIKFVVADMKRTKAAKNVKPQSCPSPKPQSKSVPKKVSKIQVLKSSNQLFDMDCTVDITLSGYFLTYRGKHMKLADLCHRITSTNPGQIWRMSPTLKGYKYRLVHFVDGQRYALGEIKKSSSEIRFKPENGGVLSFPL